MPVAVADRALLVLGWFDRRELPRSHRGLHDDPHEEFERVGGFSATFPMNYNEVDYCLKLVSADFESSSRLTDVEDWEKDQFRARWLPITAEDPYSNPHLKYEVPRLSSPFAWMRRRPRLPW
jgi:hypothetical protein